MRSLGRTQHVLTRTPKIQALHLTTTSRQLEQQTQKSKGTPTIPTPNTSIEGVGGWIDGTFQASDLNRAYLGMAEVLDEAGLGMTEGGAWQADRGSQDLHLLCLRGKRIDLCSPRTRAFPLYH